MRPLLLICFMLHFSGLQSQSELSLGYLPEVTLSRRWSEKWSGVLQVESMQELGHREERSVLKFAHRYLRTDLAGIITLKLNPLWSVAGSYLLRLSAGQPVHRIVQQMAAVQRQRGWRMGHRVRTDQSFSFREPPRYRLRYRFSVEIPLRGQTVNDKEWYFITSVEELLSVQARIAGWEQRLVVAVGYNVNSQYQLESGLDYRLDKIINDVGRHRLWWSISIFNNF